MDSEESFVALVNAANPAAYKSTSPAQGSSSQHPPTYPPFANAQSRSQPAPSLMDPFFDDDEDLLDLSPATTPRPMQSQESGLPLTHAAAPPAGLDSPSPSLPTHGAGQPYGWNFESQATFPGNASFPGAPSAQRKHTIRRRKKWKWRWPWEKEIQPTGERVIVLNNSAMNIDFCSNFVSTSKYNVVTFTPKFLKEQFSKYANVFFLFTACIQQIPGVSPTNQYTTIAPLAVVLLASAFKEVQEDMKRHRSDSELNARGAKVLNESLGFDPRPWRDIRVGDIV
ncbi:hypothetical protein PISMIDRAFT_507686, partial [Pisolithus microcarpus 441]